MFPTLESEIQGDADLLNVKRYKQLAKKCLKESTDRIYEFGKVYHAADLNRDSVVKGLPRFSSEELVDRSCMVYSEYEQIGEFLFQVFKIDRGNSHVLYRRVPLHLLEREDPEYPLIKRSLVKD